jgi:hypothetical protein
MDYRSALHESVFTISRTPFGAVRQQKKKNEIFDKFLMDKKRLIKMKYVEAKNGKYAVINKASGVAAQASPQ